MIHLSVLDVADNSVQSESWRAGIGRSHRRYASVGDVIVRSVKEASPEVKLVKGK